MPMLAKADRGNKVKSELTLTANILGGSLVVIHHLLPTFLIEPGPPSQVQPSFVRFAAEMDIYLFAGRAASIQAITWGLHAPWFSK
jgi:hypothetical protein